MLGVDTNTKLMLFCNTLPAVEVFTCISMGSTCYMEATRYLSFPVEETMPITNHSVR